MVLSQMIIECWRAARRSAGGHFLDWEHVVPDAGRPSAAELHSPGSLAEAGRSLPVVGAVSDNRGYVLSAPRKGPAGHVLDGARPVRVG